MNNKFETLNINIQDVIEILIDLKFKIFIIFLICMLAGFLYAIYTPKKLIGTLTINTLNSTDANAYNELELIISEVIRVNKRADQIVKTNSKEENKTEIIFNDPYIAAAPINSKANNIFAYFI